MPLLRCWLETLGAACLVALLASPSVAEGLLSDADFARGGRGWSLHAGDAATVTVLPESGDRRGVLRAVADPGPGDDPWSARAVQAVDAPLPAGTSVRLTVVARSPDRARLGAYVERAGPPYEKVAGGEARLTPAFEAHVFEGVAEDAYATGGWRAALHLAADAGEIEVDSVAVDLGVAASAPGAEGERPGAAGRPRAITPEGQGVMPADVLSKFRLSGAAARDGELELVRVEGRGFDWAMRLTTRAQPAKPWDIQAVASNEAAIAAGDVLHLTYRFRTVETADETGEGVTEAIFELDGPPHTKTFTAPARVQHEWREVRAAGRAAGDYAPGEARLIFRMGFAPQAIEIGGVELVNYGRTRRLEDLPVSTIDYPGREADAPWRAAAAARVRAHRTAELRVEVVDAAGEPVEGASVSVEMQRHAFRFGSVINAGYLTAAADSPDKTRYLETFYELFNAATLEYTAKWPSWRDPRWRDAATRWVRELDERGLYVRGHTVVWPSWRRTPEHLRELAGDPEALAREVDAHVADIVPALADHVDAWDVVNEPYSHHDLLDVLGREAMIGWFLAARSFDPDADLYLNEASAPNTPPSHPVYDALEADLRRLLDAGAPVTGVGLQGHFGWSLRSPEELLAVLDRFAALGLKIEITEFDVDVTDEALQADYLRDAMTVFFSHPAVVSFIQWGFWEGKHWRPDAALFRKDWTIKPGGEAYRDLVFDRWWTDETTRTDAAGVATVRGFLGDYAVTVEHGGTTHAVDATLDADGETVRIELAP